MIIPIRLVTPLVKIINANVRGIDPNKKNPSPIKRRANIDVAIKSPNILKGDCSMGELMDAILERRSIRKFTDQDVSDDLLSQVMEAVKWTPSWSNTQCWEVVIVRDGGIKHALADILSPKNPATRAVAAAPVVLAVCGKRKSAGYYKETATTKFGDWFMFDLGLATQNMCLAAQDMGLGTVIVGLFDHDRASRLLNVPPGHECVALVPLGYPNQSPKAPKRREVAEFTHWDTF